MRAIEQLDRLFPGRGQEAYDAISAAIAEAMAKPEPVEPLVKRGEPGPSIPKSSDPKPEPVTGDVPEWPDTLTVQGVVWVPRDAAESELASRVETATADLRQQLAEAKAEVERLRKWESGYRDVVTELSAFAPAGDWMAAAMETPLDKAKRFVAELQRLSAEVERLNDCCAAERADVLRLQAEVDRLNETIGANCERMTKALESAAELEAERNALSAEVERWMNENASNIDENDRLRAEVERLSRPVDIPAFETTNETFLRLRNAREAAERERDELIERRAETIAMCEQLTRERDEAAAKERARMLRWTSGLIVAAKESKAATTDKAQKLFFEAFLHSCEEIARLFHSAEIADAIARGDADNTNTNAAQRQEG